MCCTDGLIGNGTYDCSKKYLKYNAEHFYDALQKIYKKSKLLKDGFPKVWNYRFLKIHNCIICSSVLIEKSILDTIGNMKTVKNGEEDYDCWLRALKHTQCIYLENPCFYYDLGHADGQNY